MQIKTDLEDFHRMRMFDLNEGEGQEITYYKDVEIEPGILPLVKLLNSKWTLTTDSCEGHWEAPPGFQYPYVQFCILSDGWPWTGIMRRTWKTVKKHISSQVTISVNEDYMLPKTSASWMVWRFCPICRLASNAGLFFRDETEFRERLSSLIRFTCAALEEAIDRQYRNEKISL